MAGPVKYSTTKIGDIIVSEEFLYSRVEVDFGTAPTTFPVPIGTIIKIDKATLGADSQVHNATIATSADLTATGLGYTGTQTLGVLLTEIPTATSNLGNPTGTVTAIWKDSVLNHRYIKLLGDTSNTFTSLTIEQTREAFINSSMGITVMEGV
jgi:hypothetical protein